MAVLRALVDKHNAQLFARKKAEKELADYKHGEADRISRAVVGKAEEMQEQINKVRAESEQKKELLGYVAAIFIRMDDLFRKAVKAISILPSQASEENTVAMGIRMSL